MHLLRCLSLPVIVLMTAPGTDAGPVAPPRESAPAGEPAARPGPPHFPDEVHVANGCYISALAYLTRFQADFPHERGYLRTLLTRNGDGRRKPHTIALVTWRGHWWLRDEYYGVACIRLPVTSSPDLERITRRAVSICDENSLAAVRERGVTPPSPVPVTLPSGRRLTEVLAARAQIPLPSEIYWVQAGSDRIPLLFFIPIPGSVAVYDPCRGTALAESRSTDGRKLVPLFARELGYSVDDVQTDQPAAPARAAVARLE